MELSTTAVQETAKRKKSKKVSEPENKNFIVETKGYRETFSTYEHAAQTFNVLKKSKIKEKRPVSITLSEKVAGCTSETVLDEIKITKAHYGEDD